MAISVMYPAKAGSPKTMLAETITAVSTSMTVIDASVLPAAPNICVIGEDENAEVVLYSGITGNTVTGLVRGLTGSGTTASPWPAGSGVARNFTSFDHDTFKTNIEDLYESKQDNLTFDEVPTADSTNPVESNGIATAITDLSDSVTASINQLTALVNTKQNALTFDSVPTANSTNPVESNGIKTYIDSHDDFKITGTVSSGGYTLTDSRIDDEHWEVDWIYFANPKNVKSDISWSTNIVNNTVTLSATYGGSTNVIVNMHWVQ